WPSWWPVRPELGPPRDKAQVRTVAQIFAERGRAGDLAEWFAGDPDISEEQRQIVESEEAWTLGVMSPRRPRSFPSAQPATDQAPTPTLPRKRGRESRRRGG